MVLDAPWTQIGSLQQDVRQLQDQLRGKANAYELHAITGTLASLERAVGEIRTENAGLRHRVAELETRQVEETLEAQREAK